MFNSLIPFLAKDDAAVRSKPSRCQAGYDSRASCSRYVKGIDLLSREGRRLNHGKEPVMPRPVRLPSISFGWYYVALQSIAGRSLVTTPADLVTALNQLRKTLRQRGARLHAGYIA